MKILGVSAFYHDSAASLVCDGEIVAAAQEERFSRIKNDASFPSLAINYCLNEAGIELKDLDYVAFYDKPFLKFERLLETYLAFAPIGVKNFSKQMPLWIKEKLFQKAVIVSNLREMEILSGNQRSIIDWEEKLRFSEHHLSHAASAFFPSPFQRAAILTADGVGEWSTTSVALGLGNKISIEKEIHFPHSLGLLYSAFTFYAGFKVNSGEYKLMGLAPYGEAKYVDLIRNNLIDIKADGSFRLNMDYFDYCTGTKMISAKFEDLFGSPPRQPESLISQKEMDIAASIQSVLNEVVLLMAKEISQTTKERNLCLAGGVALNCVTNGHLLRSGIFDRIWAQPASGDAGGALGAALAVQNMMLALPREAKENDSMKGSLLGPSFSQSEIEETLQESGIVYQTPEESELISKVVDELAAGGAIGWFQGRMEFGPRALGSRSILADPRSPNIQKDLNLKIKYRESFRPFAPSVMVDYLHGWFELTPESPYMLFTADLHNHLRLESNLEYLPLKGLERLKVIRSNIPAVIHVDYSSRIQTVDPKRNPRFYNLIRSFKDKTGIPMIVNTSFNVRGEPIACTPSDAIRCFMNTELDLLVLEGSLIYKSQIPRSLIDSYREQRLKKVIELD